MAIGLFIGIGASLFLVVWSALGSWVNEQVPVDLLWWGAPILFVAGLVLAALGRVARFFPNLWTSFSSTVGVACLVSAIVCFTTDQRSYGVVLLVWMAVLVVTFSLATWTGRER